MNKRMLGALILVGLFFGVELLACNLPIFYNLYLPGFITKSTFTENLVTGDYHSLLHYGVIAMFVYVFYIQYILADDKVGELIRYTSRENYLKKRMLSVIKATFFFVVLKEILSIGYVCLYGDVGLLIKHGWLQGIFLQSMVTGFYFLQVYIFLEIVASKTVYSLAVVVVICLFCSQYYIYRNVLSETWLPIADLEIIGRLCINQISIFQSMFAVLRMALFAYLIYQMLLIIKQREDYLKVEKR